ncbi:MAG TPA: type II secretion system F family protein [Candidatus Nanoarchaeia archaeon]|nr:type II secretion system F family protein [Candidatus Nanoarchaeia archaeon]
MKHYVSPQESKKRKLFLIQLAVALVLGIIIGIFKKSTLLSGLWVIGIVGILVLYSATKVKLEYYARIKKMENNFPDFLQIMASNLRAGMPTDQALLMSARKELDPLDKEIAKLGKELMTGINIEAAMIAFGERTHSQKIKRTISLILSGIKSGGNIATLLEETAARTRERYFIQKRASSNVLMYVIFIFAALTVGAPGLFGLSTVLVGVLTDILSTIPVTQTATSLPFTLSAIDLPISFIVYFSIVFIIAIDILGAFILGLVTKGEEREGVKYVVPLIVLSLTVFFSIRFILLEYFGDFFTIG